MLAVALGISSALAALAAIDPKTMRPGAWTVAFLCLIPITALLGVVVWRWGAGWSPSRMAALLVLLDLLVVTSVLGNSDRMNAAINLFLLMPPALYAAAYLPYGLARAHEGVLVVASVTAIGAAVGSPIATVTTSLIPLTGLITAAEMVLFQRRSLERALVEVDDLAVTDPLTGLLNRRGLERGLVDHGLAADCAVLMLDLDLFKALNDEHGHAVGDQVLVELSAALRAHAGPGDLVARTGGEEFLVLIRRVGPDLAARAERVREGATRSLQRWGCTVSLGAAHVIPTGDPRADLDSASARADSALYAAKAAGRARTEVDGPPT
jgi:diguanylate cyclase (GGDEF)-like protein